MRQDKEIDMHAIFTRVKENQERLRSCPRHSFDIDITPGQQISKKWACIHCKGEVDTIHKAYYEDGLKHEREAIERTSNDKVLAESLHGLIVDINKALGSDEPENWTRDGILNRIQELNLRTLVREVTSMYEYDVIRKLIFKHMRPNPLGGQPTLLPELVKKLEEHFKGGYKDGQD